MVEFLEREVQTGLSCDTIADRLDRCPAGDPDDSQGEELVVEGPEVGEKRGVSVEEILPVELRDGDAGAEVAG